ncbi:MAG: ABC transporter substrate-binding protein [Candidatus Kariarchaeaceae archaeon]|jgi:hypothetical protein
MDKKTSKILMTTVVIICFITSSYAQITTTKAGTPREPNFELTLILRPYESLHGYILPKSLEPLGIKVNIEVQRRPEYVTNFDNALSWDLIRVGYNVNNFPKVPSIPFEWRWEGFIGLETPAWKAQLLKDTGRNQSDIDAMMRAINDELNIYKRNILIDEFAKLFMDELLYELPIWNLSWPTVGWSGYTGVDNDTWDDLIDYDPSRDQNGDYLIHYRALGATWDNNPAFRNANSSTFRLPWDGSDESSFDPYSGGEGGDLTLVQFLHDSLLNFQNGLYPHPGLAYQWFQEDWIINDTYSIENGKHTFWIRDDAYWSATLDAKNNTITKHQLDANDFAFTLQLFQDFKSVNLYSQHQDNYNQIENWEVSTTLTPNDTISLYVSEPTIESYYSLGKLQPMPVHILNHTLEYNTTHFGLPTELSDAGLNPQDTKEWTHWRQCGFSCKGYSLVGPYEIAGYNWDSSKGPIKFQYRARDDYYYPNEWDAHRYFNQNPSAFPLGFDIFAPHWNNASKAHYWAFNGTESSKIKPTSQGIEVLEYMMEDSISLFKQGLVDYVGVTNLLELVYNSSTYVKERPTFGPPLSYVFNLQNPHLKKLNVRKAIAYAYNLDIFGYPKNQYQLPAKSPIGHWSSVYQDYGYEYNYKKARDLMILEGYWAEDSNMPPKDAIPSFQTSINTITDITISDTTESSFMNEVWVMILGFLLSARLLKPNRFIKGRFKN